MVLFGLSHFTAKCRILRALRIPLVIHRLNQFLCLVDIDPCANIGLDLLIPYISVVVNDATATVGSGSTFMQNVTMEDGVLTGPNAVILVNIII